MVTGLLNYLGLRMHGILIPLLFEQRNVEASGGCEFKSNGSSLIKDGGEVRGVADVVRCGKGRVIGAIDW